MNVAEMIVTVGLATEFLKRAAAKANLVIKGAAAVVLSIVVSGAVVAYFAIQAGEPFTFQLIVYWLQVAVGANAGYALVEKAGGR